MADLPITGLTAIASLTADDVFAVADDPAGTPASRKATIQQILDVIDPMYGSLGMTGNVTATTFGAPSTPVKMLGATAETSNITSLKISQTANNRLEIDAGAPTKAYQIAVSLDFTSVGNNKVIEFCIAKNGVLVPGSIIERKTGTAGDVGALALHGDTTLAAGDYLEVWVANNTDTANITVKNMYMFARGMPI